MFFDWYFHEKIPILLTRRTDRFVRQHSHFILNSTDFQTRRQRRFPFSLRNDCYLEFQITSEKIAVFWGHSGPILTLDRGVYHGLWCVYIVSRNRRLHGDDMTNWRKKCVWLVEREIWFAEATAQTKGSILRIIYKRITRARMSSHACISLKMRLSVQSVQLLLYFSCNKTN